MKYKYNWEVIEKASNTITLLINMLAVCSLVDMKNVLEISELKQELDKLAKTMVENTAKALSNS